MTRRLPLAARLAIYAGLALTLFTVIASQIYVRWSGIGDLLGAPSPWCGWWPSLVDYLADPDPITGEWLLIGAGFGAAPLIAAGISLYRAARLPAAPTRRVVRDNKPYGDARWMTLREAWRAFRGPTLAFGGLAIAEAYEPSSDSVSGIPFDPDDRSTWGYGGKAKLLIDECRKGSTHSVIVAGSGFFKTASLIASMFTWSGSTVVLDPSEEIGPMVIDLRRRMGHNVFILSPERADECGFNALDWIDTNSPLAEDHVLSVVEWIAGHTSRSDQTAQFFKDSGKTLLACFLADMLWADDREREDKTLRNLRLAISVDETELRKRLKVIAEKSRSSFARELAADLSDTVTETFSGLRRNAAEDTKWLSIPSHAALVSGSAFRTSDITNGRTDIFASLPLAVLQDTPAVGRTIIGALTNAAYQAKGRIRNAGGGLYPRGRIYFPIDEAYLLGYMPILVTARDAGRKYGLTLQLLYQSLAQIERQWGRDGATAWFSSSSWRSFAAIKDPETAEQISKDIGEYGEVVATEGRQRSFASGRGQSLSRNYQEIRRRLHTKEKILYEMREDEQIIFHAHGYPLRAGRPIYFRREGMVAQLRDNPFMALAQRTKVLPLAAE